MLHPHPCYSLQPLCARLSYKRTQCEEEGEYPIHALWYCVTAVVWVLDLLLLVVCTCETISGNSIRSWTRITAVTETSLLLATAIAKRVKGCLTIIVVPCTSVILNQRQLWLNMFRQQLTVFAITIARSNQTSVLSTIQRRTSLLIMHYWYYG